MLHSRFPHQLPWEMSAQKTRKTWKSFSVQGFQTRARDAVCCKDVFKHVPLCFLESIVFSQHQSWVSQMRRMQASRRDKTSILRGLASLHTWVRCHCVWTKCTCPRQKHTNGSTHHQSSRLQRLKLRIAATVPFSFATTALYCCDSALDRSNSDFDCSTDFPVLLPKKQTLCCCNKALQCGQTTLYCRETFFMAAKGPFTAEIFFGLYRYITFVE